MLIVIVIIGVLGGLAIVGIYNLSRLELNQSYQEPATEKLETKPLTKVECDWTGISGAQIIEQQATEGYRFTGRTSTFFCENALAFELKEQQ